MSSSSAPPSSSFSSELGYGPEHLVNADISYTKGTKKQSVHPIPMYNSVDNQPRKPEKFIHYLAKSVDNIEIPPCDLVGCVCDGDCSKSTCACIKRSNLELAEPQRIDDPSELNYHFDDKLFVECSSICSCRGRCGNRLTPDIFDLNVELYKVDERMGFSVRVKEFVERGRFIGEFTGELLTVKEAEAQNNVEDYSYHVWNKANSGHYVDPTRFGNVTRFFNHNCLANLTPIRYLSDHRHMQRACIGFVANRTIKPDDELTIDYGPVWWKKRIDERLHYCQCDWFFCVFPPPDKPQLPLKKAKELARLIPIKDHHAFLAHKLQLKRQVETERRRLEKQAAKEKQQQQDHEPEDLNSGDAQ